MFNSIVKLFSWVVKLNSNVQLQETFEFGSISDSNYDHNQ